MNDDAPKVRAKNLEEAAVLRADHELELADRAREKAKVDELHAQVVRLIQQQKEFAKAFDTVVAHFVEEGKGGIQQPDEHVVAAIQAVAMAAIDLARITIASTFPKAQA